MFASRTKRPILGVDITVGGVKLVELTQSGAGVRLEACASEPIPAGSMDEADIADIDAVAKAVRRAHRRSGARSREAAVAIAGDAVVTRMTRMPGQLSDDEMQAHAAYQAEQFLPFPMEEANLDYEVTGPSEVAPGMLDVLLVAARSVHVSQRQRALRAGGLEARIVEPAPHALERACRLLTHQMIGGGWRQSIAVVEFGAATMTFSALSDRKLVYTRNFPFGGQQFTDEIVERYGLDPAEAERAMLADDLPEDYASELLAGFREDMAQQVSRSLQFFLASQNSAGQPVQVLLDGGCARLPGVAGAVEAEVGIPTQIADPFGHIGVAAKAGAQAARGSDTALMTACGLALRNFD